MMIFLWSSLWLAVRVACEVSVLPNNQVVYDTTKVIKVHGEGFKVENFKILLELGATDQPLTGNRDYLLSVDSDYNDGLVLTLLTLRRWVKFEGLVPPVPLILKSVKFTTDINTNLLFEPVVIAYVMPVPAVVPSNQSVFMSEDKLLHIRGTGWIGSKSIDLVFDPVIHKEIDYVDISPYPLTSDEITMQLRDGFSWRTSAGPLKVMEISSGGEMVKLNGELGVKIANVVVDPPFVSFSPTLSPTTPSTVVPSGQPSALPSTFTPSSAAPSVVPTHNYAAGVSVYTSGLRVYHSTSYISIAGKGFMPDGRVVLPLTFEFNQPMLENIHYQRVTSNDHTIKFQRIGEWKWPIGQLAVMSVSCDGITNTLPVPISVAMVFEDPVITPTSTLIRDCQTHSLVIEGSGFTDKISTRLTLVHDNGENHILSVTENQIVLKMVDHCWSFLFPEWSAQRPVQVASVDAGAGEVKLSPPVTVGYLFADRTGVECKDTCKHAFDGMCQDSSAFWAHLDHRHSNRSCADHTDCADCGGPDAIVTNTSVGMDAIFVTTFVYQSALHQSLKIYGTGFSTNVSLTFDPMLQLGVDYQITSVSFNWIELIPVDDEGWPDHMVGEVCLDSITKGDAVKVFPYHHISTKVLMDPRITANHEELYETQSRTVFIHGIGLKSDGDVSIKLYPSPFTFYVDKAASTDTKLVVRLTSFGWLPVEMSFKNQLYWSGRYPTMPLQIVSIDVGAGEVVFSEPVVVAQLIQDRPGYSCSDTCTYARDGLCDGVDRCDWGTDCSDCGAVLTNFPSKENDVDDAHQKRNKVHFSFMIGFFIGFAVIIIVWTLRFCKTRAASKPSAVEMTRYVSVPQIESDISYL